MIDSNDVIEFWFKEVGPSGWFTKSDELDRVIKGKFSETVLRAISGELMPWRETSIGRLAEIIVLDQFSRNIFRNQKESFSQDPLALCLSQFAIASKNDQGLSLNEKAFLYMPLMHSESRVIHKEAIKVFSQPGLENYLNFEIKHFEIIDMFGRYPHRNIILGRESTKAEIKFLNKPGSSF